MSTTAPALLDAATLSRRLSELAGEERSVLVEFLLHLEEFDRRQAWLEAGYPSLWEFCLRVLHLREGSASRRIRAMRALRRLPGLAAPLRDGRLGLSTVGLLEPVLTEENAVELIARAAYRSQAEVELLVVTLRPRGAPRDGLRRRPGLRGEAAVSSAAAANPAGIETGTAAAKAPAMATEAAAPASTATTMETETAVATALATPTSATLVARPTVRPVAADTWSLRVTVDADFKRALDQLSELLSHQVPRGDLSAVLREAVRCAIEKHGRRKGAVEPVRRKRSTAPAAERAALPATAPHAEQRRAPVSAEVRRQVWRRDGGCCAWTSPDGHRCGSRWRLEVDHLEAASLGGPSTLENLRLTCGAHNRLHAEQTFGRDFMDRFRRERPRMSDFTSAAAALQGRAP